MDILKPIKCFHGTVFESILQINFEQRFDARQITRAAQTRVDGVDDDDVHLQRVIKLAVEHRRIGVAKKDGSSPMFGQMALGRFRSTTPVAPHRENNTARRSKT